MPSKKKTANKTYKNGKQPRKYNKTRPQREVSDEGGEFGWSMRSHSQRGDCIKVNQIITGQQQWSLEQVARNTGRSSKNDTKGPQRSEYQVTFVSGGFLYNESSNVHVATEVSLLPAVISKNHEKRIGAINEGLYNQRRSGKMSKVQLGTGTISSISDDMKHATCHSNESQSIASDEDIVVFAGRSGKKPMIAESPSTFIGSSAYHPRSRNRGSTDVVRQPPNRTRRGSRSPGNVQWNQYTWGITSMREGLSLSESDEEIVRSTSTDDEAIRDYMENLAERLSSTNSDREEKLHSPSTHTSNKRSFALDQASDRFKTAISKVTPNSHDYSRILTKHQDKLSVTSSDTADQAAYDLQAALDTLDGGSDTNSWADNVQYPGFLPIADRGDDCGYSRGELDQPKNDNDSIQRQDETDSAGAEWIQTLPNRTCVRQSRQNFVRDSILDQEVDQVESTTFDIMDRSNLKAKFERPRRSPQFDLELSDSELEQVLRASWEADKLKKRTRKKEREEARAKGLIGPQKSRRGGSTGIDDLDWSSMKSKITDFLMSNQQM